MPSSFAILPWCFPHRFRCHLGFLYAGSLALSVVGWLTTAGAAEKTRELVSPPSRTAPPAELPEGLELVVVAAAPLVNHPMMGCWAIGAALSSLKR